MSSWFRLHSQPENENLLACSEHLGNGRLRLNRYPIHRPIGGSGERGI